MDLTGKWRYTETYDGGQTEGELFLKQEGEKLSGRIVFTDKPEEGKSYMMQEFLEGCLQGIKMHLKAVEYDIIHADFHVDYELDDWFGIQVDPDTIAAVSNDTQGVAGNCLFERII